MNFFSFTVILANQRGSLVYASEFNLNISRVFLIDWLSTVAQVFFTLGMFVLHFYACLQLYVVRGYENKIFRPERRKLKR